MKHSITILFAALLSACGLPIDKDEFSRAKKACEQNDGLLDIYQGATAPSQLRVECRNGASFKLNSRGEAQ